MSGDNLPSIHQVRPPAVADYMPPAIQKAVLGYALRHPGTIYPVALGAAVGFTGWLFGVPAFYAASLLGILAGPAHAVLQIFFFHKKNGKRYLDSLKKRQEEYEESLKEVLRTGLKDCLGLPGGNELARHGMEQFSRVQDKMGGIREMLDLKLDPREMTYHRFLGVTEQACLGVLDNLKGVVAHVKSAASINPAYIQTRLAALKKREQQEGSLSGEEQKERAALAERAALRESQIKTARGLLAQNEEALTEMERVSAAIAAWNSDGRFADVDFESALARLQELAHGAGEYNIK
jgi:hypothetical protein